MGIDREQYRLYAKLPVYNRRVARAQCIITQALTEIPGIWAVSCSGGKDSVVLLDLCFHAGWRGPVFHFWYDETPGENTELVTRMSSGYGLPLHILKVPGAWEVYEEVGHFFVHPETPEEKAATNRMLREYKRRVNEYVTTQGWVGQFMGLRRTESHARNMTLLRKGVIYQTQDRGVWTACPLAGWQHTDVWAYIVEHELPYLSRYDRTEDLEWERSETTWLAAESLWRYGMAARLKRENSEEFYRLAAKWAEIRWYI